MKTKIIIRWTLWIGITILGFLFTENFPIPLYTTYLVFGVKLIVNLFVYGIIYELTKEKQTIW